MPNFGANYKEQETYYASQEYKDGVERALEEGNKLPTYKTRDKKYTSRRNGKRMPPLSYPIATGPSQRTGDRLVIKCLEFEPPEAGAGATITPTNLFKTEIGKDGKPIKGTETVFTNAERKEARDNIAAGKPGGYGSYTGKEKIGLEYSVTDANTRMSKDANRLMKYLIELPIPQDLTDSNSITWGEDRANALELAALAVAQQAMGSNIGDSAMNLAQSAVTALNTGIDIPGLKPETQGAVRAALSGAAIGALGSNVSPQSVISRSTGQILNNNLELLFQGVNLRTFPYSITFSPRSPTEATVVKKIIRRL